MINTGALAFADERVIEACVPDEGASLRVFAPTLELTGLSTVLEQLGGPCGCTDDAGEPDGPAQARSLETTNSARTCGSNADYFAVDGEPGTRTSLTLSFGDDADIDMDLLDTSGGLAAASRGIGAEEWLEVNLGAPRATLPTNVRGLECASIGLQDIARSQAATGLDPARATGAARSSTGARPASRPAGSPTTSARAKTASAVANSSRRTTNWSMAAHRIRAEFLGSRIDTRELLDKDGAA